MGWEHPLLATSTPAPVCERGPLVTLRLRGSPFTAPASEAHTTTSDGQLLPQLYETPIQLQDGMLGCSL